MNKNQNFKHFLITRFNLKKDDWSKDKNAHEVLDKAWVKDRIVLFKKYCLPSIVGQSDKNFKWLIFFQENPSGEVIRLIKELENISYIEAVFVKGYKDFQTNLSDYIVERIDRNINWVLTTRLDNDDSLNTNYIQELRKATREPIHNTLLHFPNGLFLDLGKETKLGYSFYPLNQFVSLLENASSRVPSTVLCREHDSWDSNYLIKSLDLKDAWLQITHEHNMVNQYKGVPVYSTRLKSFRTDEVKFQWDYNIRLRISSGKKRLKAIFQNVINRFLD